MSYGNGQAFESICKDDSNCERKAHDFFKQLEDSGKDPHDYTFQINHQTTTPLHIACKFHNASVLKIIFQHGCRPNATPDATTALHDALEYDGSLRQSKKSVIRKALRKHTQFFKVAIPLFASHGFDFQQKNHEGGTVAHICAKNGLDQALKQIPPQELQKMLHLPDSKSFTPFKLANFYFDKYQNDEREKKAYGAVLKVLESMNKNDFSAFVGSQSSSGSKPQVSHSNRSKSGTSSLQRTSSQSSRPRSGRISAASTSHSRQKPFSYEIGDRVEVMYNDGNYYGGYISSFDNNQVWVKYDDYEREPLTDTQKEGCKPGRFYKGMLVMSQQVFSEQPHSEEFTKIYLIQKSFPNNLYNVKHHDEGSFRLKGNQMRQVLVGDKVYAPYHGDSNLYEAIIRDMRVEEAYIDVEYKEYPDEPERLTSEYFTKIYTITEWKSIQQLKIDAEKAEEERQRLLLEENKRILESEKKRKQKSEEVRRRREDTMRKSRRRESVERQMSRGSSSRTTQSSARESVFGASVDRSVHRSQSAASSHHYNNPPPPTKEEEEEDIPDNDFYTVLALLPEMRKDEHAFLTSLKENGIKNSDYFWKIIGKSRDWVESIYNHFTNELAEKEKLHDDAIEKQRKEIENLGERTARLQNLIDTKQDQLYPFISQTHDEIERYKKENAEMKKKLEEYKRDNAEMKQKLNEEPEIVSQLRQEISEVRHENRLLEGRNRLLQESVAPPPGADFDKMAERIAQLEKENEELKLDNKEYVERLEAQECIMCKSRSAVTIAVPCGHFHFCSSCMTAENSARRDWMRRRECAICKGHVDKFVDLQKPCG